MKIRITKSPQGVNPAYGLTVGSVHVARPNRAGGAFASAYTWFVDVQHGNVVFPVGIRSDEAELVAETAENAERLVKLLYRIATANTTHGDAEWLRERLTAWLNVMVGRGESLGYMNADDEQAILDALDDMQL